MFHDAVRPTLPDGRYRVTLTPMLASGASPAAGNFEFEVGNPAADPGVLAVHPPDGAEGAYGDELPMVLLRRRTIPWEKNGFGQAQTPWLTVVVTREEPNPEAHLGTDGKLVCADLATQTRLLARPAEVPLLCHVREVNIADTVLDARDDDGWQAVVVANRLPCSPGRWRATLVSLDGRADLLGSLPALELTALYSWTFAVSPGSGGFASALAALAPTQFGDATAGPGVNADGSVMLTTRDRSGVTSPSTYRSPLAGLRPTNVPADASNPPERTADAAFHLGRLLAIADSRMLRELAQSRAKTLRAAASAADDASAPTDMPAMPAKSSAAALPPLPTRGMKPQALAAKVIGRWSSLGILRRADARLQRPAKPKLNPPSL